MEESVIELLDESEDEVVNRAHHEIINLDDTANYEEGEVLDEDDIVDNLIFEVKFKNNAFFQRYSTILVKTFECLNAEQNERIKCNISAAELSISAYVATIDESSKSEPNITEAKTKTPTKEQSPDLTGIKELFTIDPSPSEALQTVQVPSYKRSIKNVLDAESAAEKKPKLEDICQRPRPTCYNCGNTNHSLRDCPQRRDMRRINNARKQHTRGPENRYHASGETKFPHIQPGVISENLRRALGLRSGELPFFFYRMRVLGYPPGWLQDAIVKSSGLSVINANGAKESSEIESQADTAHQQYDVSKIIDFPGFNVRPKGKFYDDYKYHNVPPMQNHQSKENFIKCLGSNVINGYKPKKLNKLPQGIKDDNISVDNTACVEVLDMDIEDVNDIESATTSKDIPDVPGTEMIQLRTPSPTLADLEAQQNALLQALETDTTITEPQLQDNLKDTDTSENIIEETATIITPPIEQATTPEIAEQQSPLIKESHIGTPILKFSPFNNLPSGDNFKVGVSDVINFENLPDSTGKYEQMKVVIRKVRNIVTQIKQDNNN